MPVTVKMPDGKIAQFPDGMKPSDIEDAVTAHYMASPEYAASMAGTATPPGVAVHPSTPPPAPTGLTGVMLRARTPDPITPVVKNLAKGAGEGALHTLQTTNNLVQNHTGAFGRTFGLTPDQENELTQESTPDNTTQAIGRGAEQVGEFFLPGPGEEAAFTKLAPYVGKAAPALKMGLAAIGAGTVNKAQGGNFGTGALSGAIGSGVGQVVKAVAPAIAESALNIRKLDRAYGKGGGAIGRAILDETTGFSPSSVAESAQSGLNVLNPQLNDIADAASVRPNNVRALLPAPAEPVPLHSAPDVPGTPSRVITLTQADRAMPPALPSPSIGTPISSRADIFADQLPGAEARLPQTSGAPSSDMGAAQYFGQVPGERGGPGQVQGVLLRRPEAASGPIPTEIINPSASLNSARGILTNALGTAARQGERTTAAQLQPMVTHLGETVDGQPIPENVTPRQLLDLKRGFGNEFIHRWNPETMNGVKGTAAQTYHELANSFNDAVPGAQELNSRISTLIPIAKRAESAELNAPTTQRAITRLTAHTGALASSLTGGYEGYRHGGVAGAIGGGITGLIIPEVIGSPSGQMALARGFNLAPKLVPGLTGTALQLDRPSKQ